MQVVKVKNTEELQKILDDDDLMEKVYEDPKYEEYEITNTDATGEDMIVTSGYPYFIEDLGLLIIEGTYCNNEDGEFMPDWSLTLIYKWDAETTEFDQDSVTDYEYFEQDPPLTSIHNYLWAITQQNSEE